MENEMSDFSFCSNKNTPNLWFGVKLSRNYSFADKQGTDRGPFQVVRKFLYRNFLPQKFKNGDTCSPF